MSGKGKLTISFLWLAFLIFAGGASAQKKNLGKEAFDNDEPTPSTNNETASENKPTDVTAPNFEALAKERKLEGNSYLLKRGDKEHVWETGLSPFNPSNFAGPKEYDVFGRDLQLSTYRFGRIIGTKGPVVYEYLLGVTPLAVFTQNEIRNPAFVSAKKTPNVGATVRKTTWGIGFQPVNFRFIFMPRRRLKPFAQVGAGILLTSRSMPVPRSTPINFTGDFGGGFQYFTSPDRAVTFGYKYFHISNGNIGGKINNPGYNANVFYISYSFFSK